MDTSFTTYLIPVVYLVYGYIFRFRTPEYLGRSGLSTKQSKRGKEIWKFFHRLAGLYCFAAAALTGAMAYWQTQIADVGSMPAAPWICLLIELATIAALIPAVNALTKHQFPENAKQTKKK